MTYTRYCIEYLKKNILRYIKLQRPLIIRTQISGCMIRQGQCQNNIDIIMTGNIRRSSLNCTVHSAYNTITVMGELRYSLLAGFGGIKSSIHGKNVVFKQKKFRDID